MNLLAIFQTLLFAPANHQRKVEKALNLSVDVVIIDLEDACAIDEKVSSRSLVVRYLKYPRASKAYVRVNAMSTPFFFQDMNAVITPELDGIVLPKVETPEDLIIAEWYLSELEKEKGFPAQSIDLIPIIETGKGVSNLKRILENKNRVKRIAFGAGDFTTDTGMEWNKGIEELYPIRTQIVIESRAAGIDPPIDTVYVDLKDDATLEKETRVAKKIGYQGKLLIHPNQIDTVKRAFTPTEEEIQQAKTIIKAFEEAENSGSAAIRVGDKFVDYPIVYKAQKTLELIRKQ